MGLESATYISQLDEDNPVGGVDKYYTADDHVRLVKHVLQAQFPSLGPGAVTATRNDINILLGTALDGIPLTSTKIPILVAGAAHTGLIINSWVNSLVAFSDATDITFDLPLEATMSIPVGKYVDIIQLGAGNINVGWEVGVGVFFPIGVKTKTNGSVIRCLKVATNTWTVLGDAAP